jgi:hypothetical protein
MVTIWCACGAVSFPTGNPARGVALEDRLAAVAAGVDGGVVTLTVEPQWHPGGASLAADCAAVFADLDLAALCAGLEPGQAALLEAAWVTPRVLDDADLVPTAGGARAAARTA